MSTDHTTQDTSTARSTDADLEWAQKEAAAWAEVEAALREPYVAPHAPQEVGDPFRVGVGRFRRLEREDPKTGSWYVQDRRALETMEFASTRTLVEYLRRTWTLSSGYHPVYTSRPMDGLKRVLYTGIPRGQASCQASNFGFAETLCFDFDGISLERIPVLKDWIEGLACDYAWHTTSSHDPSLRAHKPGEEPARRANIKYYLPVNVRLTAPQSIMVHDHYRRQLEALGIIADPTARGIQQPQTIPVWRSEEVKAHRASGWVDDRGPLRLATLLEDLSRLEEERRQRDCPPIDLDTTTLTGRLADYARYLEYLGPAVEKQGGFAKSKKATLGARGFGLDVASAWPIIQRWNVACNPPWSESELRARLHWAVECADRVPPGFLLARIPQSSMADVGQTSEGGPHLGSVLRSPRCGPSSLAGGPDLKTPPEADLPSASADVGQTSEGGPHLGDYRSEARSGPPANEEVHTFAEVECVDSAVVDVLLGARRPGPESIAPRVHRRYLAEVSRGDLDLIPERVWIRDSVCDTGKNYSLKGVFEGILKEGEIGLALTHRQSLSEAQSATLGLTCYRRVSGSIIVSASVCLDSIGRIDLDHILGALPEGQRYPIRVTLWDECDQLFRHLAGGTLRGRVPAIYSQARDIAVLSQLNILQEDDCLATGIARRALQRMLGAEYSERIQINTYRKSQTAYTYKQAKKVQALLLEGVGETLSGKTSVQRYVTCSTFRMAVAISDLIRSEYPAAVLEITSETTDTDEVSEFFADTSKSSLYHVIVTSPACQTGVSLDAGEWVAYGFLEGGFWTSTHSAWQQLQRPRNCQTMHLHIKAGGLKGPADPTEVYLEMTLAGKLQRQRLGAITSWDRYYDPGTREYRLHPHNEEAVRLFSDIKAYANVHSHLHKTLVPFLESRGVQCIAVEEELEEEEMEEQTEILKGAMVRVKAKAKARTLEQPKATAEEIQEAESRAGTPHNSALLRADSIRSRYGTEDLDSDLYDRDQGRGYWGGITLMQRVEALEDRCWHAVARLEALDLAGEKTDIDARESLLQALLVRRLLKAFGFRRLKDALEVEVEEAPDPSWRASFSVVDWVAIKRLLGGISPMWDDAKILGILASRCGLQRVFRRGPRIIDAEGKETRPRIYRISEESYHQAQRDSEAYRTRLRDPEGLRLEEETAKAFELVAEDFFTEDRPSEESARLFREAFAAHRAATEKASRKRQREVGPGIEHEGEAHLLDGSAIDVSTPANHHPVSLPSDAFALVQAGSLRMIEGDGRRVALQAIRPCMWRGVDLPTHKVLVLIHMGEDLGWWHGWIHDPSIDPQRVMDYAENDIVRARASMAA